MRWGLKEAWSKGASRRTEIGYEAPGRTSGQRIAKSISINGQALRSGGCAPKAIELTPGDLRPCRPKATGGIERPSDRRAKSAEGIVGPAVGKASEALQGRKAEATDRLSRER